MSKSTGGNVQHTHDTTKEKQGGVGCVLVRKHSTPEAGKRLCAWFNTREGCSMPPGQCKGEHRDAASNKEKKMITNFLKAHPDRHPK